MKEKKKNIWKVIITIMVLIYVVLTATIFVIKRKKQLLEQENKGKSSKKMISSNSNVSHQNIVISNKEKEEKLLKKVKEKQKNARKKLAQFYYITGKTSKAIEQYQEKLKENPDNADTHFELGKLYMSKKNGKKLAIKYLRKTLKLSQNHPKKRVIELWIKGLEKKK